MANTTQVKYLGGIIRSDSDVENEVRQRISMGWDIMCKLDRVWKSDNLPIDWKLTVYIAMVQSKVIYGLETIRWLPRLNKIILHHESRCFRKILKVPSTYVDRKWTDAKVRQTLKDKLIDKKRFQLLAKLSKTHNKATELAGLSDLSLEQKIKLARQRAKIQDISRQLLNIKYELPSITETVKKRRLGLLGHLLRSDVGTPEREAALHPSGGPRRAYNLKAHRPCLSWQQLALTEAWQIMWEEDNSLPPLELQNSEHTKRIQEKAEDRELCFSTKERVKDKNSIRDQNRARRQDNLELLTTEIRRY